MRAQLQIPKKSAAPDTARSGAPPAVHSGLRSPLPPVESAALAPSGPRIGHDFSRVRVHSQSPVAGAAPVFVQRRPDLAAVKPLYPHEVADADDAECALSRYKTGREAGG
jgi:hypothetical protein